MSELSKCQNCGGMIPKDAKFCSFCGSNMISEPTELTEQEYIHPNQDNQPPPSYDSTRNVTRETNGSEIENKRIIAAILAFLFGGIGMHHFFLGNTEKGILYLCFCWTGIPEIIAFIEAIIFLTETDEEFEQKHVVKT